MKFIRLTEEKITSSQEPSPVPSRAKPPNRRNSKLAFAIALALSWGGEKETNELVFQNAKRYHFYSVKITANETKNVNHRKPKL